MDRQKIIGLLVERHGIKLDPHDPAFLIVDLNLLMLEGHAARLQQLGDKIAALPETAGRQLQEQTNQFVKAAGILRNDLTRMADKFDEITDKTAKNAMAGLKDDIGEMAKNAVLGSLDEGDARQEIKAAVAEITDAAKAFSGQAREDRACMDKASKRVSWSVYKLAALVAGISLAASLLGGFVVVRASVKPAAELSAADAKALETGRALVKAWPSLTPRERERISDLVKAGQ
jgi:hypothetical protein